MNWLFGLFRRENMSVKNLVKNPETEEVKKERSVKEKRCSYCKGAGHNVKTCVSMNAQMDAITSYFSKYKNRMDIDGSKAHLLTIDKKVINRYLEKHNIRNYMYSMCSVYYDNNIRGTKRGDLNVKLMIGYLCVLPLHPEIIIKRVPPHSIYCNNMSCNDKSHDKYRHRSDENVFSVRIINSGMNFSLAMAMAGGH
jgi:hypothetical protein